MTLAGELAGAFLAGVGFTLIGLAIAVPRLGPRLIRWQMKRTLKMSLVQRSQLNDEGTSIEVHRVEQ